MKWCLLMISEIPDIFWDEIVSFITSFIVSIRNNIRHLLQKELQAFTLKRVNKENKLWEKSVSRSIFIYFFIQVLNDL